VPGDVPDVVLSEGSVPRALDAPLVSEERWDAEPGRFLVRGGRRAGRFLVEAGTVTLERNPGAEDEILALCFIQEVLPAVLRQRGRFVLHANAAVTPVGVAVIAGPSGAGKSTTLAALMERGCAMLADDVTALELAPGGQVQVLPGVAQVHLTAAAASGLGYRIPAGTVQPWRRMKSAVATGESMARAPARLSAIYVLGTHDSAGVRVRPLTGFEKFDALQGCVYGPMLPDEHPAAFPLMQAVMRNADVYRLERPAKGWSVNEVAEILLGY
jgi:hypothetical protein